MERARHWYDHNYGNRVFSTRQHHAPIHKVIHKGVVGVVTSGHESGSAFGDRVDL